MEEENDQCRWSVNVWDQLFLGWSTFMCLEGSLTIFSHFGLHIMLKCCWRKCYGKAMFYKINDPSTSLPPELFLIFWKHGAYKHSYFHFYKAFNDMSLDFHQPDHCTVSLPWSFSIYNIKCMNTESQTRTEMTWCLNNIAHQWITNQQNDLVYDYNFIIADVWLIC